MTVSSVKNLNGETFSAVQDASLTDIVSSNSANWNEISAYQANSANYLRDTDLTIVDNKITEISGVPLSAGDELPEVVSAAADYVSATSANINSTIDNVSTNSGAWGGSALPISAGQGVKISLQNDTLVFSNDETVLFFAGNDSSGVQSGDLTESIMNFERIRVAGMDNDGHVDVKYIYPAWTKNADNFDATGYEVMLYGANPINNTVWEKWTRYSFSALTSFNVVLSYEGSYTANSISDVTNSHKNSIREVVGINRIAGGN